MRVSGWMALAEAAGRTADAALSICWHKREERWPAAVWAAPELQPLVAGWQPAPWSSDEPLIAEARSRRLVPGAALRGLLPLGPELRQALEKRLSGSAAIWIHLRGRPPALLWLGFREEPRTDRLLAIADLIEAVGTQLPSRHRLFIEQAPLVFISADRSGRVVECNEAATSLGYSSEELIGRLTSDLFPPGELERFRALVPGQGIGHQEVTVRDRAGETIPVEMVSGLIRDDDGEVLETVALGRDLRAERRLEHHRRLEAVGRLVSGVAHELNNPLLTVVGNAEMLAQSKLPTAAKRRAERVLAGARRCQDVVDGLLRLRIKRKELDRIVDLGNVLRQAVRMTATELQRPAPDLQIDADGTQVRGDSADLAQAVGQLVRNAIQAIEGRSAGRVRVHLQKDDEMAHVTVEDNGPGMPPDVLGRAFEPFFTTREVGKGRGLGLSIAMGLVQDHGGYIELRSSSAGTVATISLPLVEQTDRMKI